MEFTKDIHASNGKKFILNPPPERHSYIEPYILPYSSKLIFGGQSKLGKSTILLEMARILAIGGKLFEYDDLWCPNPVSTLIIEQELGAASLHDKVMKIYKDIDLDILEKNLFLVSKEPSIRLGDSKGVDLICRLLDETGARVLALDPVSKFHNYDENDASEISKLLLTLDKIIEKYEDRKLSIIFSHHTRKPSNDPKAKDDQLSPYAFRGSSKWFDDADTLMMGERYNTRHNAWGNKMWDIRIRWTLRHGDQPDDQELVVNELNDLRVRWKRNIGEPIKEIRGLKGIEKVGGKLLA